MEVEHETFMAAHDALNDDATSEHNMIEAQHQEMLTEHRALIDKYSEIVAKHEALEKNTLKEI
jgi:hypothetical protein